MIIANGTKPQEQILKGTLLTIKDLAQAQGLKPPALIIAGKTIDLYRPSPQKTFLHCGTHPDMYRHLGTILHWPMIEIKPVNMSADAKNQLVKSFETADMIVLTSWYAAEFLLRTLSGAAKRPLKEQFKNKLIAVIGQRTLKALQEHDIKVTVVSGQETAQGLFKAITRQMAVRGKRILFPRSSLPNPYLKKALRSRGATVKEITIYTNTKPAKRKLPSVDIDGVIFSSPSTVRNFLKDYGTIPSSWQIMAKGPVTLKTLKDKGYKHAASLS
jgi:uroporphyrinogen-III synthase